MLRGRSISWRYATMCPCAIFVISGGCKTADLTFSDLTVVNRPTHVQWVRDAIDRRRDDRAITQTLAGALAFLDDTQVRDRKEPLGGCETDSCLDGGSEPKACFSTIIFNEPGVALKIPLVSSAAGVDPKCTPDLMAALKNGQSCFKWMRNTKGEWSSYLHLAPAVIGFGEHRNIRSLFAAQDSNLFMSAAVTYPLYLIDEGALPAQNRFVSRMREQAAQNIDRYRHGEAYNFWTRPGGELGSSTGAGPYNIPIAVVDALIAAKLAKNPRLQEFWTALAQGPALLPGAWLADIVDKQVNPYGAAAVFNLPPDAGNTSMAVVIQYLRQKFDGKGQPDLAALRTLDHFRDVRRSREYGDSRWLAAGAGQSGAYLTWLKPEASIGDKKGTFKDPKSGVIPLHFNNLDCVVYADGVFAQALSGNRSKEGFTAAMAAIVQAVTTKKWPECGIYHPQRMAFPYAVSRAFRDGGLGDQPEMALAMGRLLHDLLDEQADDGSFSGGVDSTKDLPTALGVIALIHIGRQIAQQEGVAAQYTLAIQNGINYLVKQQKPYSLLHDEPNDGAVGSPERHKKMGAKWDDGLFFSIAFWDFAHVRSQSYTTATVVEALVKYLIAYEYGDITAGQGRRLKVISYSDPANPSLSSFQYTVE